MFYLLWGEFILAVNYETFLFAPLESEGEKTESLVRFFLVCCMFYVNLISFVLIINL